MGRRNVVQCPYCGDEIEGITHEQVVEDALHLGWDYRGTPSRLVCPPCLDDEEMP
jgi:hypothetical protein